MGFSTLKEAILNTQGIKYIAKGINNPVNKLKHESLIRCNCVFTYIPQKHIK